MRWLVYNTDKRFCFPPSPLSVPKLSSLMSRAVVLGLKIETLRFKMATRDDDAETNDFKRMTGQKSCRILSIV